MSRACGMICYASSYGNLTMFFIAQEGVRDMLTG